MMKFAILQQIDYVNLKQNKTEFYKTECKPRLFWQGEWDGFFCLFVCLVLIWEGFLSSELILLSAHC